MPLSLLGEETAEFYQSHRTRSATAVGEGLAPLPTPPRSHSPGEKAEDSEHLGPGKSGSLHGCGSPPVFTLRCMGIKNRGLSWYGGRMCQGERA